IARGGPVKTNNLYYIHTLGDKIPGSLLIKKGLYMGGSFEAMIELLQEGKITPKNIRFFVGYAGWSEGQLQGELNQNAWVVSNATVKEIMDTSLDNLWEVILKRLGGKYKVISNFPADPRLN
ncbi:MAG: YqgE/AlgH family protein, partial [Flavobacteriales bacterium]